MYRSMAKKVTAYLLKNNTGHDNYRDIYEYGFECGFSILANIIIVIAVGFVLNMLSYLLVYMAVYTALRINTGGFHCKKHYTCIITYLILALISIPIFSLLHRSAYNNIIVYICLIVSIALVVTFAPVGSANKKISDKLKNRLRKKGIATIIILSIIITCLTILNMYTFITIAGTAAILVQSVTLTPIFNRNVQFSE